MRTFKAAGVLSTLMAALLPAAAGSQTSANDALKLNLEDATNSLECLVKAAGGRVGVRRFDPSPLGFKIDVPVSGVSRRERGFKPDPPSENPQPPPCPAPPNQTEPVEPTPPQQGPNPVPPPGPRPFRPTFPALENYRKGLEEYRLGLEQKALTGSVSKESYGLAMDEYKRRMDLYKEMRRLSGESGAR